MPRMQTVAAYVPTPTMLVLIFHPSKQRDNFRIMSDPDDLTPIEIREILEAALTVANQAIADELVAVMTSNTSDTPPPMPSPDASPPDAPHESTDDVIGTQIHDDSEMVYVPLDDARVDDTIGAVTAKAQNTKAIHPKVKRPKVR